MSHQTRLAQVWTIARLQLLRVFFSKRSFWVYGLALFPSLIFLGHGVEMKIRRERWSARITPAAVLESIQNGASVEKVLQAAGEPINDFADRRRRFGKRGFEDIPVRRHLMYYDGRRRWDLDFEAGILRNKRNLSLYNFEEDRAIFANIFQYFYLRLAIFFGCLGIFMNLFRGEMLDRTLHFWFLAPLRREVLLAGKYVAGLIASVLIFGLGAALCYGVMLWLQDPAELDAFWRTQGPSHLLWYAASAALGCVGYGSVFLAAGLLLRNPIIPAVAILFWEMINGVLPDMLQKVSVVYYVQALTPVPTPLDPKAPLLFRLLFAPASPPSTLYAVLGLLAVTVLVLWAASLAVRRLEINYSTD